MCSGLWYHCISAIRDACSLWPPGEWCFKIFVIGLLSSVLPLARWRYCVLIQASPLLIRTLLEVDRWKTVHLSEQKSPRKGTSVGCPLGNGKSVGVAERFTWPVGWSQIGTLKRGSGRSGASFTSQKNNASATFFALSPKPIARFRWERASLLFSGLNHTCQVSSKSIQVSEIY